ncbi:MAG: hypothetical protein U0350_09580 [Caldilineaceae bacterium]
MEQSIFKPGKNYTFSDYFELNYPTREIVQAFDYHYRFEELILPKSPAVDLLEKLRQTYTQKLPLISLNSEAAKREFYIAPLLLELLDHIRAEINVEYPLDAGENLSGAVDYLVRYHHEMVIIEAKKGDLEKGFNQLAVELIALDKTSQNDAPVLYGAITLGDIWRFGVLKRADKSVSKDMNAYVLPADLEQLFAILLGILNSNE